MRKGNGRPQVAGRVFMMPGAETANIGSLIQNVCYINGSVKGFSLV